MGYFSVITMNIGVNSHSGYAVTAVTAVTAVIGAGASRRGP